MSLDPLPPPRRRLAISSLELPALGSSIAEDRVPYLMGDWVSICAVWWHHWPPPLAQLQEHWQPGWSLPSRNLEDSFLGKMSGSSGIELKRCWGLGVPWWNCPVVYPLVNSIVDECHPHTKGSPSAIECLTLKYEWRVKGHQAFERSLWYQRHRQKQRNKTRNLGRNKQSRQQKETFPIATTAKSYDWLIFRDYIYKRLA